MLASLPPGEVVLGRESTENLGRTSKWKTPEMTGVRPEVRYPRTSPTDAKARGTLLKTQAPVDAHGQTIEVDNREAHPGSGVKHFYRENMIT